MLLFTCNVALLNYNVKHLLFYVIFLKLNFQSLVTVDLLKLSQNDCVGLWVGYLLFVCGDFMLDLLVSTTKQIPPRTSRNSFFGLLSSVQKYGTNCLQTEQEIWSSNERSDHCR